VNIVRIGEEIIPLDPPIFLKEKMILRELGKIFVFFNLKQTFFFVTIMVQCKVLRSTGSPFQIIEIPMIPNRHPWNYHPVYSQVSSLHPQEETVFLNSKENPSLYCKLLTWDRDECYSCVEQAGNFHSILGWSFPSLARSVNWAILSIFTWTHVKWESRTNRTAFLILNRQSILVIFGSELLEP